MKPELKPKRGPGRPQIGSPYLVRLEQQHVARAKQLGEGTWFRWCRGLALSVVVIGRRLSVDVGRTQTNGLKIFKADVVPTKASHSQFRQVIGPYRTRQAAVMAAAFGYRNPQFGYVRNSSAVQS